MDLRQLLDEFGNGETILQQKEHSKAFIGREIEFSDTIKDIEDNRIDLYLERQPSIPYRNRIYILFDEIKFSKELLAYSCGDDVKIKVKLSKIEFSSAYSASFTLDLISIRKTGTTIQSRREAEEIRIKAEAKQREDEEKDKENAKIVRNVGFVVIGGILGLVLLFGVIIPIIKQIDWLYLLGVVFVVVFFVSFISNE